MKYLYLILVLATTGCTNFMIRQECKPVNWYQHGFDVAMQGRRLSGDPLVEKCEKAEFAVPHTQLDDGFKAGMAQYCIPDVAFQTGRSGQVINLDMCASNIAPALKRKNQEGINAYCNDGLTVGASGKAYTKVCTQEQEKTFLPLYQKGRRQYLTAMIATKNTELSVQNNKIESLERDQRNLEVNRSLVPPPREIVERVHNSATGTIEEKRRTEDPWATRRQQLEQDLIHLRTQLSNERNTADGLRKSLVELQTELAKIPQE